MALTENQLKLLKGIRDRIVRGDIVRIAETTGKTREYVGRVLNPLTDTYCPLVVTEAVKIISEREQNAKKLLEKVVA